MIIDQLVTVARSQAPLSVKGFMAATIVARHIHQAHGKRALHSGASRLLLSGLVVVPMLTGLAVAAGARRLLRGSR